MNKNILEKYVNMLENKNFVLILPKKYVYHISNPIHRKQIEKLGLIPKEKSDTWLSDTPINKPCIFATNDNNKNSWFDSGYDDDVYRIDTTLIKNKWFKDPNFEWGDYPHIITFENIPKNAIKLIYIGSGLEK